MCNMGESKLSIIWYLNDFNNIFMKIEPFKGYHQSQTNFLIIKNTQVAPLRTENNRPEINIMCF